MELISYPKALSLLSWVMTSWDRLPYVTFGDDFLSLGYQRVDDIDMGGSRFGSSFFVKSLTCIIVLSACTSLFFNLFKFCFVSVYISILSPSLQNLESNGSMLLGEFACG